MLLLGEVVLLLSAMVHGDTARLITLGYEPIRTNSSYRPIDGVGTDFTWKANYYDQILVSFLYRTFIIEGRRIPESDQRDANNTMCFPNSRCISIPA